MTEQELANVIWDIKEIIRNLYDDSEVEQVILPFTLLRRLDCVLDGHREEIMKAIEGTEGFQRKFKLESLMRQHKLTFFNTSGLSMERLLGVPDQIGTSFKTYIEGFTQNVRDILSHFVQKDDKKGEEIDLSAIYSSLEANNKLFAVVQMFVKRADLHPDKVSNAMMGTVFEIVIRRSKEASNTKAGQFYTPREIVRLLARLTLCGQETELYKPGRMFTIYDPCCGTGGMLTVARDEIRRMSQNPNLKVYLYGQELNHKTYAICKSDLLMKGDDQDLDQQLFRGDTLGDDKLIGKTFNYMLANPPFGVDWGKDEVVKARVEKDNCAGGRFEAGLPSTNDGSLLFLQHMISKMDTNGSRIGIVLNGSPLFNGDAGSGWSNIRKMLLDKNLLDCIVALPKNLFYGTDISTYLWILDNKRPATRSGKVLFINAAYAEYTTLLQKNLGKKRFEISDDGANDILEIYRQYQPATRQIVYDKTGETETLEIAKLLDYEDFEYTSVAVRRPLRLWYENITSKYEELCADNTFKADDKKNIILKEIAAIDGIDTRRSDTDFFAFLKKQKQKVAATQVALIRKMFGTICEDAPEVLNNPSKPDSGFVADGNLNDTEKIPFKQVIDEYFEREVLRFIPDAWMDREKDKVGCEIPFTKLFYVNRALRPLDKILADLKVLEDESDNALKNLLV
mgnify:CR=1 FL=1